MSGRGEKKSWTKSPSSFSVAQSSCWHADHAFAAAPLRTTKRAHSVLVDKTAMGDANDADSLADEVVHVNLGSAGAISVRRGDRYCREFRGALLDYREERASFARISRRCLLMTRAASL